MGTILKIKDADFSENSIVTREIMDIATYKQAGAGYVSYSDAVVGQVLTLNGNTGYDGYFIPLEVATLDDSKYIVPSYYSNGSSLLGIAVLGSDNTLLKKIVSLPGANTAIPATTIVKSDLGTYAGEVFKIYVCQSVPSGGEAISYITKEDL